LSNVVHVVINGEKEDNLKYILIKSDLYGLFSLLKKSKEIVAN